MITDNHYRGYVDNQATEKRLGVEYGSCSERHYAERGRADNGAYEDLERALEHGSCSSWLRLGIATKRTSNDN